MPNESTEPGRLNIEKRLKFLAKDTLLYGAASALNSVLSLISFPILTRYFSVEDYGIIDFFSVAGNLLVLFFIFGQDAAVARYFYEYKEMPKRQQVVSQSLIFQITIMLLLLPPLWFFTDVIIAPFHQAPQSAVLVKLILLQTPFQLFINFSQNLMKWTFSRKQFLFISVGSSVFTVSALVTAILWFHPGIVHIFYIYLISQAIFGIAGLYFCRQWFVLPAQCELIRLLFLFAAPYGILGCIGAFMPALERTFIIKYLTEQDLGIYAAGAKIALIIQLPIQAFQTAWGPFALSIYKEKDATETYNWILKIFSLGIFAIALLIALAAKPLLILLASERFAAASAVVFPITLGVSVQAIGWITQIGINFSKKSYLTLYAYALYLVFSIAAIYVLLHAFGLTGVAWGVSAGYIAKSVYASWLAQRAYPIQWAYQPVIGLGLFAVFIGAAGQFLFSIGEELGCVFITMGIVVLVFFGWKKLFTEFERSQIFNFIRKVQIR